MKKTDIITNCALIKQKKAKLTCLCDFCFLLFFLFSLFFLFAIRCRYEKPFQKPVLCVLTGFRKARGRYQFSCVWKPWYITLSLVFEILLKAHLHLNIKWTFLLNLMLIPEEFEPILTDQTLAKAMKIAGIWSDVLSNFEKSSQLTIPSRCACYLALLVNVEHVKKPVKQG